MIFAHPRVWVRQYIGYGPVYPPLHDELRASAFGVLGYVGYQVRPRCALRFMISGEHLLLGYWGTRVYQVPGMGVCQVSGWVCVAPAFIALLPLGVLGYLGIWVLGPRGMKRH